jgi:very-short-patch-repair endonuclease
MANYKLPPGAVSKKSLESSYGFNFKHLQTLLSAGVLTTLGHGVSTDSLANLEEGVHYVVCLECGSKQAAITSKHLKMCSGVTLSEYKTRHPHALLASSVTNKSRAKSAEQKLRQSETLKARFQTPAGEVTRKQISEAAKKLMATEYRQKASDHLRDYAKQHREEFSRLARERWQDPEFRAVVEAALIEAGVQGMCREFSIGYYRVDEAIPDKKVAIEIDGCYWHGCSKCGFPGHPDTLALDVRKSTYLVNRGWKIIRIPEHRVKEDLQKVVQEVVEVLHAGREDA